MKLMALSLRQRVEIAIESGFSVGQIAGFAGTTSSAVSQWRSGNVKSIKATTAAALERGTGWNATWWATGTGPRDRGKPATDLPQELLDALIWLSSKERQQIIDTAAERKATAKAALKLTGEDGAIAPLARKRAAAGG